MTREEFIQKIAPIIQHYAPLYHISVCSPIIAQAILESDGGNTELAKACHNYFGLKWREGRCPTATGTYMKIGSEQNKDGSYTSSPMLWCMFDSMESGVIGYFDFTKNYVGLKGVTDPKTYLENIKKNGYATSINYVSNLMRVINTYNLTRFDHVLEDSKMLKVAIDCGHGLNTAGKRITLKGYEATREWELNRRIGEKLETLLKSYQCEVMRMDDASGLTDVSLSNRANKANNWGADVYISIHHNAGINGGSGGGTLVYYYSSKAERQKQAQSLYNNIVKWTNLRGNRSSQVLKKPFTVLLQTKMPAFLIENGFMDSATDVPIILSENHVDKTAQGILDFLVTNFTLKENTVVQEKKLYKVQCGAFSSKKNAEALLSKLKKDGYEGIIVEV